MLGFKCLILYLNLGFVSEVDETIKHALRAIAKSHTALSPAAFLPWVLRPALPHCPSLFSPPSLHTGQQGTEFRPGRVGLLPPVASRDGAWWQLSLSGAGTPGLIWWAIQRRKSPGLPWSRYLGHYHSWRWHYHGPSGVPVGFGLGQWTHGKGWCLA